MDSVSLLKRMIKASAQVALDVCGATASVELREPQFPDSILRIRGIPADAIVIKMDSFPAPDALFNCDKGECKRADYVIVAILPNKRRILYLELKRTKASRGDVVKQLLGAECALLYCKQVAEAFFDEASLLAGYQSRFVSCGHTSINKRRTRIERSAARHDRPERFMKVDWPSTLEFNHLVGG
jgi:hypothetical protein